MSWKLPKGRKPANLISQIEKNEKETDNSRNLKVLANFDDGFKVDGRKERKSCNSS